MNSFLSDWKAISKIPNKLQQLSRKGSLPGYVGGARVDGPKSRRKFQSSDDIERNSHSNKIITNVPTSKSIFYSTNDSTISTHSENPESPLNGNLFPNPHNPKIPQQPSYLSSLLLPMPKRGVGIIVKPIIPPSFQSPLPFAYKISEAQSQKGFLIFDYKGIPLDQELNPINVEEIAVESIDKIYSYGLKWKIIY